MFTPPLLRGLAALLALSATIHASAPFSRAELAPYAWSSVRIGGGGFVTGIVCHPLEPGLIYIRTDVGGTYRWSASPDAEGRHWIPLNDSFSWRDHALYSIDGIALDPTDPDRVWIAAGNEHFANGNLSVSDVLRSPDRGKTWQRTGLDRQFSGNGAGRSNGERIAVDPRDGDKVLVGTRKEGLWRTSNAWAETPTWTQVTDGLPADANINSIVFSPAPNDTARVYASAASGRVYRSDDGGLAWHDISGEDIRPRRLAVGSDGVLWVTTDKNNVRRYTPADGAWITFIPDMGDKGSYCGIAVDPSDPRHIIVAHSVSAFGNRLYQTTDAGTTWRKFVAGGEFTRARSDVAWTSPGRFASAVASVAFDPHSSPAPGERSRRAFFGDWYHTWMTDDISAPVVSWGTKEAGHEEVVVTALLAPPANPAGTLLYSGHADVGGFAHDDLASFPARSFAHKQLGDRLFVEVTGIDYCPARPGFVALSGADDWHGGVGGFATSEDGGHSLRVSSTYDKAWGYARVAVSATDPANIVALTFKGGMRITRDGGATWRETVGVPTAGLGMNYNIFNRRHPLHASRIHPSAFFLYSAGKSAPARLFRSTDGGATWSAAGEGLPTHSDSWMQTSAFGLALPHGTPSDSWANDVWAWSSDKNDGIYRSQDHGTSFTQLTTIREVQGFALGALRPGAAYPALYAYGKIGDDADLWLYRSDDAGASWLRVNDAANRLGNMKQLSASPDTPGLIFVGTGGRGVLVGRETNP